MLFLVSNHCRPQLVSNYKSCRNSLGPNVGRALVEDGDDVVLLDLLRDTGPELTLHVSRILVLLEGSLDIC